MTIGEKEAGIRDHLVFIQSQLRSYSACSVVAVALHALDDTKPWTKEDVQAMPWLTLLLVKWVMQDPGCRLYQGQPITRHELEAFRQRLWNLTGPARADNANVFAMLRSILPVQIDFQRRSPWSFMRWACLTARLPPEHASRKHFETQVQLTPEEFVDACWLLHPPLIKGSRVVDASWLRAIPRTHKHAVSRVLTLLGTDFLGLRTELSRSWPNYTPSSWELFELPFARRLPFLQVGESTWRIWHPAMFERGLEDAVHQILTPLKGVYTESFSRVFEDYVTELSREVWPDAVDERAWKNAMGHNAPAVEAILPAGPVNVFIEAKMSLFHDAVIIDDSPEKLASRLERVIGAVGQGWKVSQLLRERKQHFPRRAEATEEYLLIVTSRELNVGGGIALQRLLPPGMLEPGDEELEKRMPLENIFVLSIEAFEHLNGILRAGKTELVSLLRSAAAANRNAATSALYFDDHLKRHAGARWPVVDMIRVQREAATERLKRALQGELPPQ